MSAFIVNRQHIDAMVAVAMFGPSDAAPSPGSAWRLTRWLDTRPPQSSGMAWYIEHQQEASADGAGRLGDLLTLENVRSVEYRYSGADSLPGTYEGTTPDWINPYDTPAAELRRLPRPSAVECLKLLACYEYQSCEHPGWRDSEAAQFCDALRRQVVAYLPGFDAAPWEWTFPMASA